MQNSELILKFWSLLKIGHDFWTEASPNDQDEPMMPAELLERETDLIQASLSGDSLEVAHTVSGYVRSCFPVSIVSYALLRWQERKIRRRVEIISILNA